MMAGDDANSVFGRAVVFMDVIAERARVSCAGWAASIPRRLFSHLMGIDLIGPLHCFGDSFVAMQKKKADFEIVERGSPENLTISDTGCK
jgi:hypothetical protein